MKNLFSKKILLPISIAIILSVSFLVFSQTALGERIDFKDLPAAIKEAIISVLGLKINPGANLQSNDSVQLVLIAQPTYRAGTNNIGDVVGVFDGDHQFSEAEIEGFTIIRINGVTKEQVDAELQKLLPDTSNFTDKEMESKITRPKYNFKLSDTSFNQMTETQLKNRIETNVKLK